MKNRVKLLCLEKGINTSNEFALSIGIGYEKAKAIWEEKEIIEYTLIERLVKFFNVSAAYLLCVCEKEA